MHRAEAIRCESPPRTDGAVIDVDGDAGISAESLSCLYDTDCDAAPNGRCQVVGEGEFRWTHCEYFCSTDEDCSDYELCECRPDGGKCTESNCRTDQDCGVDQACIRFEFEDDCYSDRLYGCTTPEDECRRDSDCDKDMDPLAGGCRPGLFAEEPAARCEVTSCAVVDGRPFLVAGVARTAPLAVRSDWLASPCDLDTSKVNPLGADLTPTQRAQVALHWADVARMEHASVAAFARFALQLLALGAPARLLEQTHAAMADEVQHARLAFGLASRYAGSVVGPGALDCSGGLDATDLKSAVRGTLLEGCIGETLAALDARHALEGCSTPVVREVLEVIVRDETRHAELAWRFVMWALEVAPGLHAELVAVASAELERARAECVVSVNHTADWSRAHGITDVASRKRLRVEVLQSVVLPCLRALERTQTATGRESLLAPSHSRSVQVNAQLS